MTRWEEAQTKANAITSKWELYHNSYAEIYDSSFLPYSNPETPDGLHRV